MEKFDVSKHELLNDFLYAVCSKLGLDFDGDFLNSSVGNFIVNAKNGYIVRTKKKYADPPKMGKWILVKGYGGIYPLYACSECGRYIKLIPDETLSDYPYCLCGAKMSKEEKE